MAFLFRPFLLLDVSGESRLGIFLCFADDRFFTAKAPRAAKIIMGFALHISRFARPSVAGNATYGRICPSPSGWSAVAQEKERKIPLAWETLQQR
jgi:hypothetical protein